MIRVFRLIWQCDKRLFLFRLLLLLLTSLLPVANIYILKVLVDSVSEALSDSSVAPILPATIISTILLFVGLTLLNRWLLSISTVNNDILTQKLIDHINAIVQQQSSRLDLSYFDNPDYHDTFHRAQQEASYRPVLILDNALSALGATISLVGVVWLMFSTSWLSFVILFLAAIPSFAVKLFKSRKLFVFRRQTTPLVRRSNYFANLLTNRMYAKEIRTLNLSDFLMKRYRDIRKVIVADLLKLSRRIALFDALSSLFEALALLGVLLLIIDNTIAGAISVGSFVMLFETIRRSQGLLNSLVSGISGLYQHKLFVNNIFEFLELTPLLSSPANPSPFPSSIFSISFDHVSFSYPGMNKLVLDDFNLVARQGEITQINEMNGFGKTTLLKLLLRLYDPSNGRILINNIDIRQFDITELRRNISVIFQDYVQFYLSVRENITIGDLNSPEDAHRLAKAIQMANLQPVIDALPDGLNTQLGTLFTNGHELSMGQWQRLSLARQLYSAAPILLFDEPTAWMDESSQHFFLESLEELKHEHLIILVSHSL